MITINDNHPDLPEFITIKNDPERKRVRYANISVKITEEFIRAVENDEIWTMWYESEEVKRIERKMPAREIWRMIVENAWASAEPGIILWSNIKKYDTGWYCAPVISTNPCSEIPLEPYGACNLSNINLSYFVLDPFTDQARIDYENLERALRYNVRFLDNAIEFVDKLFRWIKYVVYDEGVNLAIEKGPFPDFDPEKHLENPYFLDFDEKLIERIRKYGLRNVAYLTVPPVGSGSALAGVSSGIEPIFALYYTRRSESLSQEYFRVYHPLAKEYMEMFGLKDLDEDEFPDFFITAHKIKPEKRVEMQAVIQKHIDQSISSTINLPETTTPDEIGKIYFLASKMGLKGVTVYREGSREGVLITEKEQKEKKVVAISGKILPKPRPYVMTGRTYRFKTDMGTVYITVNAENGNGPREVFIHLGKSGSSVMAMSEAIGRLISLALRSDISPDAIIHQLKGIKSSSPVRQPDGSLIWSVPDAIARAIEEFLSGGKENKILKFEVENITDDGDVLEVAVCPECGEKLINESGCWVCKNCGYTKCE
jgi:ribonucleoside-diphosphate reductase alpha chain